eukprot:scaffold22293_cov31-Tisochrysis_lutea.AAC.3
MAVCERAPRASPSEQKVAPVFDGKAEEDPRVATMCANANVVEHSLTKALKVTGLVTIRAQATDDEYGHLKRRRRTATARAGRRFDCLELSLDCKRGRGGQPVLRVADAPATRQVARCRRLARHPSAEQQ